MLGGFVSGLRVMNSIFASGSLSARKRLPALRVATTRVAPVSKAAMPVITHIVNANKRAAATVAAKRTGAASKALASSARVSVELS
jgi:hypothetical protein